MQQFGNIDHNTFLNLKNFTESSRSQAELRKLFGVLILSTQFEFSNRRDLWSRPPSSKYNSAPCLGNTGISRNRFENLVWCLTFPVGNAVSSTTTSSQLRWNLVNDNSTLIRPSICGPMNLYLDGMDMVGTRLIRVCLILLIWNATNVRLRDSERILWKKWNNVTNITLQEHCWYRTKGYKLIAAT